MGDDEITTCALAAGRGDSAALTAFVRGTQADVWRYVAYIAGREHADDLTQETYLRAMRSLPGFRGEAAARAWLLGLARGSRTERAFGGRAAARAGARLRATRMRNTPVVYSSAARKRYARIRGTSLRSRTTPPPAGVLRAAPFGKGRGPQPWRQPFSM